MEPPAMPIIIWGSRGVTSNLEHGRFFCPGCRSREEYTLKQVRRYFTIYFIPLFPLGQGQTYVECDNCGRTYKESVLEYEPPSEGEQLLARVYDELKDGASVDSQKRTLLESGMSDAEAEETLVKMRDGKPQQCSCGQRLHPDVRECAYCGGKL
jgi:hypothetical protein